MKLLPQTISIKSFRTKQEVIDSLKTALRSNKSLEYTGTVKVVGTFTGQPNPAKGFRGRGTMPLFFGHIDERENGCTLHITFHFPPGVALMILIAEIITGAVGLLMYLGYIKFGNFPVFILPVFGVLTLIFVYAAYSAEVTQAKESLKGAIR